MAKQAKPLKNVAVELSNEKITEQQRDYIKALFDTKFNWVEAANTVSVTNAEVAEWFKDKSFDKEIKTACRIATKLIELSLIEKSLKADVASIKLHLQIMEDLEDVNTANKFKIRLPSGDEVETEL